MRFYQPSDAFDPEQGFRRSADAVQGARVNLRLAYFLQVHRVFMPSDWQITFQHFEGLLGVLV
jgi:hypothetical protein